MRVRTATLAILALACLASASTGANHPADLVVDIDCDGRPDQVFLSQGSGAATVRVVFGNRSTKPAKVTFDVAPDRQSALCSLPAAVEKESLDDDPAEAIGELPGFRRSKTCQAFALSDGQCDSIHFYWNHQAQELDWWRA